MSWRLCWFLALGLKLPAQTKEELHTTPQSVPVTLLDARGPFEGLTAKEKLYAHWMSQASWWGALITFEQLSEESPLLLELIMRLYEGSEVGMRKTASRAGLSPDDLHALDTYCARVLSNCGNYLSFGDTKFIPRLSREKFAKLVFAVGTAEVGGSDRLPRSMESDCRPHLFP